MRTTQMPAMEMPQPRKMRLWKAKDSTPIVARVATNLVVTLATIGVLSFAFQSLIFLGWGISIAGICVVRILLWRLYHRHRLQADFEPQAWIRRFTYFAAATGCQWGSLATAVALLSSANADLFVPIIIAGLAGGIASDYTPHVPVVADRERHDDQG